MEKKNGTGAIFKNERKEKDSHPDYRGIIISPSGEEMQVSLWLKTAQESGKKYFSVSAQPPYRKDEIVGAAAALAGAVQPEPAPTAQSAHSVVQLDDLPF